MLKVSAVVKLERGESPQHVAEETESDEILLHASTKARQRERGEERGRMAEGDATSCR